MSKNYMLSTAIILSLLMLLAVSSFLIIPCVMASTATVHVEPLHVVGVTSGQTFSVNISVSNVVDLAGWEFQLYYNHEIVNVTDVEEGSFLKSVRNTIFVTVDVNDNYNGTHGHVHLASAMLGTGSGATGSGTLASITFRVKASGWSPLSLPHSQTKLRDSTPITPQPIPHVTVSGDVTAGTVDVALTYGGVSENIPWEGMVQIRVTALNLGDNDATFDVTTYYTMGVDDVEIETQTVTELDPSRSVNLTFTWDTSFVSPGNYTVKAYIHPIPGETNIDNNVMVCGFIDVKKRDHDVGVESVTLSRTTVYYGLNETVSISVVVTNKGNFTETFDVTAYSNETAISTQRVSSLLPGEDSTLIFFWDTTGLPPNTSYTIKANTTVSGDSNLEDNELVGGIVTIRLFNELLIRIVSLSPSTQTGDPRSNFETGTTAYFKVVVNNTSFEPEDVLITVNAYDSSSVTLGVVSMQGAIMPGISTFILGLPIPHSANIGTSTVYANVFTDWPSLNGVAYCGDSSPFTIAE